MKKILIQKTTSLINSMKILQKTANKELIVVHNKNKLFGTLNDGDIRRAVINGANFNQSVEKYCNTNPIFIYDDHNNYLDLKVKMMKEKIFIVPVVDSKKNVKKILMFDQVSNLSNKKSNIQIKASCVIMAGGFGSRLKPFSDVLPKPLLPIRNTTVIEEIINNFQKNGINKISISVNYKAGLLKTFLSKKKHKVKLSFINEKKPLGTVGSLSLLKKNYSKNFFLTNCDTLIDYDYKKIFQNHLKSKSILTIIVAKKKSKINYGVCKKNNENELIRIEEKPEKYILVNTGLYLMNNKILKFIPKNKKLDMNDLINSLIKKKIKINLYSIEEILWTDVGEWDPFSKYINKLS